MQLVQIKSTWTQCDAIRCQLVATKINDLLNVLITKIGLLSSQVVSNDTVYKRAVLAELEIFTFLKLNTK